MRSHQTALVLLLTLAAGRAPAQLRHPATTANDLALAGATQTLAGDPGTLFANPAGLAESGLQIAIGLGALGVDTRATEAAPQTRDLAGPKALGHAAISLPLGQSPWVVALAYRHRVPAWTERAPSPDETQASALRFIGQRFFWREDELRAGLAFRWRSLAVGAAFSLSRVKLGLRRTLFAGSELDLPSLMTRSHDSQLRADLDGLTVGGTLGIIWQPWWWLRGALQLDTPRHGTPGGPTQLSDPDRPPSGISSLQLPSGEAEARLDGPWRLGGGLSLNLMRSLRLLFGFELLQGGKSHALSLDETTWVADARQIPIRSLALIPTPQTAMAWRVGLELSLWGEQLLLRGGWAFVEGSLGVADLGAPLFDTDRHELGAGVVLRSGRISLCLGVKHTFDAELRWPAEGLSVVAPLIAAPTTTADAATLALGRTQVALELRIGLQRPVASN